MLATALFEHPLPLKTRDAFASGDAMMGATTEPFERTLSRGRSYTYVLPCREMDCLKVGFTRDPLARLQTLHARYFDFFDLDRAVLAEVEHVRDARALEARLKRALAEHRATEPLVVRSRAGGRTEWFRGASPLAFDLIESTASHDGFRLHAPFSAWMRDRFIERKDILYDGSRQALLGIEFARFNSVDGGDGHAVRTLGNLLDACIAVGIDLADVVPAEVVQWHQLGRRA